MVRSVRVRLLDGAFPRRRSILKDDPLAGCALARARELKIRRRSSDCHFLDWNHDRSRLGNRARAGAREKARRNRHRSGRSDGRGVASVHAQSPRRVECCAALGRRSSNGETAVPERRNFSRLSGVRQRRSLLVDCRQPATFGRLRHSNCRRLIQADDGVDSKSFTGPLIAFQAKCPPAM